MNKISYNSLDLGKFIAALLVVAIHANPFEYLQVGGVLRDCLLRLAVPFFFLTSSFLFFKNKPGWPSVKHYVRRIMILYAFWAIFSMPLFYIYHTPPYGEPITVSQLIWNFFYTSTYPGSWFLMASMESVLLVWCLSRRFANWMVLAVCLCLYLFSTGAVDGLLSNSSSEVLHRYQGNWAYASIYFAIGKIIADADFKVLYKSKLLWACLAVLLLIADVYAYVLPNHYGETFHQYLLVPVSLFVFLMVLSNEISYSLPYKSLRKMSTSFYLSHFTFVAMIAFALHHFIGVDAPMLRYLFVLGCCFALYIAVSTLSKRRLFSIFKYAF